GHMREEPWFLEDIADPPPVLRYEDAAGGVDHDRAVDHDPPAVRAQKTRDHVDDRCLAGAGAAEQGGEPRTGREPRLEIEPVAYPVRDVDFEQRQSPASRRRTRRASSSEASSAAIEIMIETKVRRSAWASPPGTWV